MRLWDTALRQQIYVGDEAIVERMQALVEPRRANARELPRAQRRKTRSLAQWLSTCESREEAMLRAHGKRLEPERHRPRDRSPA